MLVRVSGVVFLAIVNRCFGDSNKKKIFVGHTKASNAAEQGSEEQSEILQYALPVYAGFPN
jgi:hypothetical protein